MDWWAEMGRVVKTLPILSESRRESWGQTERVCGSTAGPGSLSLRTTASLAGSQPCRGSYGGEHKGSKGSQDWPTSSTLDPTQRGEPRPITSLHLLRCSSCHSNHLLPDVSLATGQECCTFLLPPGSTPSPTSP